MPHLRFGTAGYRAPVGSQPGEMNVSTVALISAGVAQWLHSQQSNPDTSYSEHHSSKNVIVGYDARFGSSTFARTAAEVFSAAGHSVTLLTEPTPTPVLAYLVKDRHADAGVQITASHNPASDNGYKLFLSGGSQLISPQDREIESAIQALSSSQELIPRSSSFDFDSSAATAYTAAIANVESTGDSGSLAQRRALKILYTPLHGVGGDYLEEAFRRAGFGDIACIASQRYPDPHFPTVDFPNPEEPGATDALLKEARDLKPDLLIALDPDADRCQLGIPTPSGYRMLTGDETGPLLARRVLSSPHLVNSETPPVVATTVVSSELLSRIADSEGWDFQETLTGFKNLARAADGRPGSLAFAYEEAIGTCPMPDIVADKDGIATALVAAVWTAELKAQGSSLWEELQYNDDHYGIIRTAQVAIRYDTPNEATELVEQWLNNPPTTLLGQSISASPLKDPRTGEEITGIVLRGNSLRIVARPSGTEPKAKFYLQVESPSGSDPAEVNRALEALIKELKEYQ